MDQFPFFLYSWHIEEDGIIHGFGLTPENETIHVEIADFTPYVYMELPVSVKWEDSQKQALLGIIQELQDEIRPVTISFMNKRRLYYANLDEKNNYKTFPYLFLAFRNKRELFGFTKKFGYGTYIPGISNRVLFKFHEQDASPVLQLSSCRDIPVTGWINAKGKLRTGQDKTSTCKYEYIVQWNCISRCKDTEILKTVPSPRILMFDCEANSNNMSTMPKNRPEDKIFQISFAVTNYGSEKIEKHLLSLGYPDQKMVGEDVIIHTYPNEGELLLGFTELIHQIDPQVIGGYNIFGWDFNYMISRAVITHVYQDFVKLGYLAGVGSEERKIAWSSSAFNAQKFLFLDIIGRLVIDMLPIIRRDFKLDKYNLGFVANSILGQTKDPLTPKGIFKCYRIFSPSTLGVVGKYCVQDSNVTLLLFNKLKTWIGSCQMSAIFGVPIIDLYTQGQQHKIYAQVYRQVLPNNFVVEKNAYECGEDESYTGAIVLDPLSGFHEDVITFDFASLYPSVIIDGNICYSTFAIDPKIPDSACNIFEWEDHVGCQHDQQKRATKVKKVICCKRRYRFLKSPVGVIPTILINLLGQRKKTREEMEIVKAKAKEEKDPETKKGLVMYASVLDMRQLALKVSANSIYGGMGVRRGKLPFMPGAMCIDGDALISTGNGLSQRLKTLDSKEICAYKNGQVFSTYSSLINKGKVPVIKLILSDGRELCCTPDHRILAEHGWIEAGQLTDQKIVIGLSYPEDLIGDDEMKWQLPSVGKNMIKNRKWLLAFARVIGFVLSDGSLTGNLQKCEGSVSLGTKIDADSFLADLFLLTGKSPAITFSERDNLKGSIYKVSLPVTLVRQIISLPGIQTGKNTTQEPRLPEFILAQDCPKSILREFLGGLFGGDGISPCLAKGHPSFSPIGLEWQIIQKYLDQMNLLMEQLVDLFQKFDLSFTVKKAKLARTDRFPPKENPRWCCGIVSKIDQIEQFSQKIGFRYSINKTSRLTIAESYQRFREIARSQKIRIVKLTSELYEQKQGTLVKCLENAVTSTGVLVDKWCIPNITEIYRYRTQPEKLNGIKTLTGKFPTASEFAESLGVSGWFNGGYAVDRIATESPCFHLKVLSIQACGEKEVYDLTDVPEESFFANGICVHNCTTAGGRFAITKAKRLISERFPNKCIYGDTDSLMIVLEEMDRFRIEGETSYKLLTEFSEKIAEEITKEFRAPMELSFENISKKFFLLTKKRYVSELVDGKMKKRGVMISRRDNAGACRSIYETILNAVFARGSQAQLEDLIVDCLNQLYSHKFSTNEYCITKSVKEIDEYKVKAPSTDPAKRIKQYALKLLDPNLANDADYLLRSLPAHVQLAEKMRKRGIPIEAGTRLEYVTTTAGGPKAKMWQKIESSDYYKEHSDIIKLDMGYYCKSLINTCDQIMEVMYGKKNFLKDQHAFRLIKAETLKELLNLFRVKIVIEQ